MARSPARFALALLASSGLTLLLAPGCEKKPPPPVDTPPPPPPPVDAGVVQLVPLDDAGDAAPEASGPARPHGSYAPINANTARIKLCCAAIRNEGKKLGAAPEAMQIMTVAGLCDQVAVQAASGNAPEFGQVRQMLKGRTLPNACAGM